MLLTEDVIHDRVMVVDDGCWIWLLATFRNGYGVAHRSVGRVEYAHRLSYEAFVGNIPEGLELDHLCRKRCCVNPRHLQPVTRRENIRRGVGPTKLSALNASKTCCKRGHPFEGDNVYYRPGGGRACRACSRIYKDRTSADMPPIQVAD